MTDASPLHVRISERRKPKHRGRVLKSLGFGLVAMTAIPLTLVMTLVGVGRLRPVSMEARSEVRYTGTFGPPTDRLVWSTLSNEMAQSPFYLAEAQTEPQMPVVALVSFAAPAAPVALVERQEDPVVTGSIAMPNVSEVEAEPARRPTPRARLDADRAHRAHPRLAALSPAEIGIKPQEDEAPRKTAFYDITAKIVYMPSGERLEAHSGLGRYMDDPRHSRLKMRGVTPPNSYRLKLRESLFHGVRAIRLVPEDEKAMYGRDGILAHPYMLGSSGQSNGCVSFKYYDKFLQAFLRGEVERIVVVAKMDKPPVFARRPAAKSAALTN